MSWLFVYYFLMHSVLQEVVFNEHLVLNCLQSCHSMGLWKEYKQFRWFQRKIYSSAQGGTDFYFCL